MKGLERRAETELDLRRRAGGVLGSVLRERGDTESAVARRLGVSQTSVNRWINNPDRPPTLPRIQQLADHLESVDLRRIAEQIYALGGARQGPGLSEAQADKLREIAKRLVDLAHEMRNVIEGDA